MTGPLYNGKKFTLSYTAMICGAGPSIKIYLHKCPFIRTAKKNFSSSKMFDEYDTSAFITSKPTKSFDKSRNENVNAFTEAISATAKKNNIPRTWQDIEREICSCVGEIVAVARPSLVSHTGVKSFALFGIDFVLDANLKPLLIGFDVVPTFANIDVLPDMLSTLVNSTDGKDSPKGDDLVQVTAV